MRYRTLDSKLIIETAERLEKRVAERFPHAGLRGVAIELVSLSRDLARRRRRWRRRSGGCAASSSPPLPPVR
jgi:hypothetical protein